MINYPVSNYSSTSGTTVVRTTVAAVVLSAALIGPVPNVQTTHNYRAASTFFKDASTPSGTVVSEQIRVETGSSGFESQIMAFYESLQLSQQDLGRDFERVLFDNLWDLYAEA